MLARHVSIAAAVFALAAPLSAQTTFTATGGDVTVRIGGWGGAPLAGIDAFTLLLADATGAPTATLFQYGPSSNTTIGPFVAGTFAAGDLFRFVASLTTGGGTITSQDVGLMAALTGGYRVEMVAGSQRVQFDVTGVSGVANASCGLPNHQAAFGCASTVPEPTTWALLAPGLAGIALLVRRRRHGVV